MHDPGSRRLSCGNGVAGETCRRLACGRVSVQIANTWRPQILEASGAPVIAGADPAQSHFRQLISLRYAGLLYAATAYFFAIAFWPLFIVFIGNSLRIDAPLLDPSVSTASTVLPTWQAFAIDAALIGAFALQHSFLARPAIKRIWGRLVAEPFRRATFTHLANIFAFAIVLHWQPIPIVLWSLRDHAAWDIAMAPTGRSGADALN